MANQGSIWGGIAGSIGGLFNGVGNVQEEAKNRNAASELEWRGNTLGDWAQPAGNALFRGLQPGGYLRQAQYDNAAGNINKQYSQSRQALASDAWKYGGASSPLAGRRWYDLGKKARSSYYNAQNEIDAADDAMLGGMYSTARLANWNADPVALNQKSGFNTIGGLFQGLGSGLQSGGGGMDASSFSW